MKCKLLIRNSISSSLHSIFTISPLSNAFLLQMPIPPFNLELLSHSSISLLFSIASHQLAVSSSTMSMFKNLSLDPKASASVLHCLFRGIICPFIKRALVSPCSSSQALPLCDRITSDLSTRSQFAVVVGLLGLLSI